MKANAITRIVIYTIIIALLVGLLIAGLKWGTSTFYFVSDNAPYNTGKQIFSADELSSLHIEWAAGTITVVTADTEQITVEETGNFKDSDAMVTKISSGTLTIQYAASTVHIGIGSVPSKDLVITVPESWNCDELEIDGAALEIDITGLAVYDIKLDGAASELTFNGALNTLECDGAAVKLDLICTDKPGQIDIDGAACELDLILPADCGFRVDTDGLAIDFSSNCAYSVSSGTYICGDQYCGISIDGMSCKVKIDQQ